MIEFIEETHTYLVDGVIVPSVSTILSKTIFKDKYKDVPAFVLQRAAEFGTGVHLAVETSEWLGLDDDQYRVYQNYLELCKDENITPKAFEKIVRYEYEFIGRYDMEADVGGLDCLCDIKTTYSLDIEYLSWQLSMYELASGKQFDKLYAIWLPKRKGAKLVEIERKSKEDILKLLEVYYETRSE
jgi:hypothetical protein